MEVSMQIDAARQRNRVLRTGLNGTYGNGPRPTHFIDLVLLQDKELVFIIFVCV